MLTLVLEKRSIPIYGPLEPLDPGTTEHLTIAFTLRSGIASYLPFVQSWLQRLPQLQTDLLAEEYPSLICSEYIIQTYGYLQTFALQASPVCAFKILVDKKGRPANAGPGLDAIRPLVFAKRLAIVSRSQPYTTCVGSLENSEILLIPPLIMTEVFLIGEIVMLSSTHSTLCCSMKSTQDRPFDNYSRKNSTIVYLSMIILGIQHVTGRI